MIVDNLVVVKDAQRALARGEDCSRREEQCTLRRTVDVLVETDRDAIQSAVQTGKHDDRSWSRHLSKKMKLITDPFPNLLNAINAISWHTN